MRFFAVVSLLGTFAIGCGGTEPHVGKKVHSDQIGAEPTGLAPEGAVGVENQELRQLLIDHWDWVLRTSPVWATTLGDHRFDSNIAENSAASIERDRAKRRIFLTRAHRIDESKLSARDRSTMQLFREKLANEVAIEKCESEQWSVSARGNPLTNFNVLPEMHKVETLADAEALIARYQKIPQSIDHSVANLRRGLENGRVANAQSVKLTVEMLEKQLKTPLPDWPLSKAADSLPKEWPQSEALGMKMRRLVADDIRPAIDRYRHLLANEVLPRARGPEAVGLGSLPQGDECYLARIQYYTGSPLPPDSLHEFGMTEIASINEEMRVLGKELFGTSDLAAIIAKLRTDSNLYFRTEKDIVAKATEAVTLAKNAMPRFFGTLPAADVEVVPIPDYEAPYTTIAYYRQPHGDGSKPGEYFINTYKPEVRPKYEMQVLAFHEAIPGHHLQIAISMELKEMPAFRRHTGNTAFVEGWALYTERLADEMGLYTGPLDRMGMLSYDAWRAARLVVDTGIHAKGWTRARAEEFMMKHTALTEENIRNEVDRYISWPGQALAYKVGQKTIFDLRSWAKKELGERFDIKGFHDAVLTQGAVSLPVLKSNVEAWVEAQR